MTNITVNAYYNTAALNQYTTISVNGVQVARGYTEIKYTGVAGSYSVTIQDYGNYVFDHWGNGSTSRTRTQTLASTDSATWTAYFRNTTASTGTAQLTVSAVTDLNDPLNGYYCEISRSGVSVAKGYTPLTITGTIGYTYSVTVGDYGNWAFDHWDNGSTTRVRSYYLGGNANLVAHYRYVSGGGTTTPPPTGLSALIPKTGFYCALYSFPDVNGQWQGVYNLKVAHPSVPFVCVFNPNSGPGSSANGTIQTWVNKMKSIGCIMLGYTFSKWGARPIADIEADAAKYKNWYNADGIFIDEFPTTDAYASYFTSVTNYCKGTLGMKLTMGNPGTNVQSNLIKAIDIVNITEGAGYPSATVTQWYKNWVAAGTDKRKLAMIRHTTSSLDTSLIRSYMPYCGLIEFTNGSDSNGRWFNYCSYWPTLVATLDV